MHMALLVKAVNPDFRKTAQVVEGLQTINLQVVMLEFLENREVVNNIGRVN